MCCLFKNLWKAMFKAVFKTIIELTEVRNRTLTEKTVDIALDSKYKMDKNKNTFCNID